MVYLYIYISNKMGYAEEDKISGSGGHRSTILTIMCNPLSAEHNNLRDHGNMLSGKPASQSGLMVQFLPPPRFRIIIEVFIGVAVVAILRSKTNAFPVSTVVIEQYRPPAGNFIIGTVQSVMSLLGD
jgi:hypothetical protein